MVAAKLRGGLGGMPVALVIVLLVLAVVDVLVGVGWGVVTVLPYWEPWQSDLAALLQVLLWVFAGASAAALLWAAAWLCRTAHDARALLRRIASAVERPGADLGMWEIPPAIPAEGEGPAGGEETGPTTLAGEAAARQEAVLEQLRELNVNLLLSDAQRQLKRRYMTEQEAARLALLVEQAIGSGDCRRADESLDRLMRLAPDLPQLPELRASLQQAKRQAEARDVSAATQQVSDLMAAGNFGKARRVAGGLLEIHPGSSAARELLARIGRERDAFVKEQRLRMYRKVEQEVTAKHWRLALAAAEELLASHPQCPEAEAVRSRLQTLRDNAQIEEARELRDKIRDLIARRRFAEAVEVARDVITRFPATAAADELRQQLGRLEELARG